MSTGSRRDFLRSFGFSRENPSIDKVKSDSSEGAQWISIGHFSVFPPNTQARIQIRKLELIVDSKYEGLRVCTPQNNNYYELKMSRDGQIFVNTESVWNSQSVLSILTGEESQL